MSLSPPPPADPDDDVRRLLRGLRVDLPDAGFREALHRRLLAAAPASAPSLISRLQQAFARWPAILWPASGIASGVAAFALLVALRSPAPVPSPPAASAPPALATEEAVHRVPADKTAVIRVNFATEVAVDDVTFEVTLPEGLSFWSRGEKLPERTFRWHGQLLRGDNPIPIAVRGERPGRYRVRAGAEAAGTRVEHQIVLEVEGA